MDGDRTLGELCSLIVDSEHKTAPKDPSGLHPLIRTTNLGRARVDYANAQRVNRGTYANWTRRARPQAGDLILAREAPVGGIGLVRDGTHPVLGQRTVLLRPAGEVDSRFLMYRLAAPDMQVRMAELATGATVPHLNMGEIRTLGVPNVPAQRDQNRVAAVLSAYDELIEINERRIELLEDLVRSLYREWFVRFRFPDCPNDGFHESRLGSIPSSWSVMPLGEVATLKYGKALPAKSRRPGPVAVVSSAGVIAEHDEALVDGPGIALGRKGNVGSVWWIDRAFFPIDTTYYVETSLPLGLLYWQLRDLTFVDSHAAVPGLSREQAYSLPLLVPPERIAVDFNAVHCACFEAISEVRRANAILARTRDLLLPRLVTGRLDISDVDLDGLLTDGDGA